MNCLRAAPALAEHCRAFGRARHETLAAGMAGTLSDRDTVPGPEPEDPLRVTETCR